jgi:hypothetical protein
MRIFEQVAKKTQKNHTQKRDFTHFSRTVMTKACVINVRSQHKRENMMRHDGVGAGSRERKT